MWPKREEQTQVRMPNLSSGQRGIPAGHQAGTILRKTRLRQCPHRRPSPLRDRSRRRTRTLHHPRRNSHRDSEDQGWNRSNRHGPETTGHHSPDTGNTLQPVSKTTLPRTRRRRSYEPNTVRLVPRTPGRQTRRGSEDYPAALEFQHRQARELQGPLLLPEQRILASKPGETAGPPNLSGSLRSQDAETRWDGGG